VNPKHVPVLITGAGAAGLSMSALLAHQGVPPLLVERRSERFAYPKARNLSFRTLEILRRLGVGDAVHAVADGVSGMVTRSTLNGTDEGTPLDVAGIFGGLDELSPEPPAQYCPQSRLEPILLDDTRGSGGEVRYGTELTSFAQDDDGVTAVLRDMRSGTEQTVRADYLVAADGTHSRVREALGIRSAGHGALPIYVIFIYFRGPWRQFVPGLADGDSIHVKNATVDGIFVGTDGDLGLFITTYLRSAGETAAELTPERCRELLDAAVGEPVDPVIVEMASWQPYEQVAERFQNGRVFLVGDAAHTMPPFKAGGANCAIQSADNLAWKLAAVITGQAGAELLRTYEVERHPVGTFSARQSLTGPPRAFLRIDDDVPDLPLEEEQPIFALLAGYQYHSAATAPHETVPHPGEVSLVDQLRGQVGTRMPHVWLERNGKRESSLDLLGAGFTVIAASDLEDWRDATSDASADLDVPIAFVGIDGPDGDQWSSATHLAAGGALLVRPDQFIGWRSDVQHENGCDSREMLRRALSEILARDGRRWSPA